MFFLYLEAVYFKQIKYLSLIDVKNGKPFMPFRGEGTLICCGWSFSLSSLLSKQNSVNSVQLPDGIALPEKL